MNAKLFCILLLYGELFTYLTTYQTLKGNETIDLKGYRLLSNSGYQFMVFSDEKRVIKIHRRHSGEKGKVDENLLKSLMGINTKRIIMPSDLVYKGDECAGYIQPLINGKKVKEVINGKNEIRYAIMDNLLNEFSLIWEDQETLSDNNVIIDDFKSYNCIYNGRLYFVDIGSFVDGNHIRPENLQYLLEPLAYTIIEGSEECKKNGIRKLNQAIVNDLLFITIFSLCQIDTSIELKKYLEEIKERIKSESIVDAIAETSDRSMTVEEYVEQLIKIKN